MDVRLPDGTVIQNVPDGTTKADLVAKLKSNGHAVPAEWEAQAPAPSGPPMARSEKFAQGLRDPINGGAQLLTKILPDSVVNAGNQLNNWLADKTGLVARLPEGGVDQQVREQEQAYQEKRKAAGESGIDGWRMAGNVVNPVNATIAARLPAAVSLAGRMGVGALGGGLNSLLFSPVTSGEDYATEKAKQVAIGGAFGGALPAVASALGRVISPAASRDPNLRLLMDEGVKPTIGQTLGGRWNALEEKMTSLPIVGDAIASARGKALDQFNSAAINRTTAPIGAKVQGTGQGAVKDAGDAISAAYDSAKNAMGHFQLDRQAVGELQNLRSMAQQLPQKEQAAFNEAWNLLGGELSPNGSMLAEGFKRLDSKLSKEVARFGGSNDAYQQKAGEALSELQRIITDAAKRANPKAAEMMDAADAAWANLVRVEGASKAGMNNGGLFTPAQLNMAVRQADTSVRDRATARGTALMQDLSNAGQKVLGNKVPNSFTTDRAMIAAGALGTGAINPAIPLGLLGGAGVYTPPAQALLRGLLASRPSAAEPIAEMLKQGAPMLSPAGGLLGLQYVQN